LSLHPDELLQNLLLTHKNDDDSKKFQEPCQQLHMNIETSKDGILTERSVMIGILKKSSIGKVITCVSVAKKNQQIKNN
jgi:hypothetical protein